MAAAGLGFVIIGARGEGFERVDDAFELAEHHPVVIRQTAPTVARRRR